MHRITVEDVLAFEELLAAARGMLNPTGHTDACMHNRAVGVPDCTKACARLRAAIERATGEPIRERVTVGSASNDHDLDTWG